MKNITMERENKQEVKCDECLFARFLSRQMFPWEGQSRTIGEAITQNSLSEAKRTLQELKIIAGARIDQVVKRIEGRAGSWNYTESVKQFENLGDISLETFLEILSKKNSKNENVSDAEKWAVENLSFETRNMLRQSQAASSRLQQIKSGAVNFTIENLKRSKTDDEYRDLFNRTVCQTADKLGISLPDAENLIKKSVRDKISDTETEEYLSVTRQKQIEKRFRNLLARKALALGDPTKAIILTSILFEIDQIKTDDIWGSGKFEKILVAGLNGEKINLISILCLINQFDYKGGYISNPNLFSYLENPKLEPVPLIVDEIVLINEFFTFYNIDTFLTVYVADTDYTEIGEYGPVNDINIQNIKAYIENLREYLKNNSRIKVVPISEITNNNPLYQEVKTRILTNVKFKVTKSKNNTDFADKWYQRFERDFEGRFESQCKRNLFPPEDVRRKTLELTRNIWACNAGQGAVLSTLGPNTILISTERRERDRNFTIDGNSTKNIPPILYVLKTAEKWNRKIVQKQT